MAARLLPLCVCMIYLYSAGVLHRLRSAFSALPDCDKTTSMSQEESTEKDEMNAHAEAFKWVKDLLHSSNSTVNFARTPHKTSTSYT